MHKPRNQVTFFLYVVITIVSFLHGWVGILSYSIFMPNIHTHPVHGIDDSLELLYIFCGFVSTYAMLCFVPWVVSMHRQWKYWLLLSCTTFMCIIFVTQILHVYWNMWFATGNSIASVIFMMDYFHKRKIHARNEEYDWHTDGY